MLGESCISGNLPAVAYLVAHRRLSTVFAGMVDQIKREITILKQIHHPNIVDLKEVGRRRGVNITQGSLLLPFRGWRCHPWSMEPLVV